MYSWISISHFRSYFTTVTSQRQVEYYDNRHTGVIQSIMEGDGLVCPQYGSFNMRSTGSYGGIVSSAVDLLHLFDSLSSDMHSPLSNESFMRMLKKPEYEKGNNWYGLGFDVQDDGYSWGHTGAMEGTSTTYLHHKSGMAWALLFNAWAKDMDIDGLIKYSLSYVEGIPLCSPRSVINDTEYDIFIKSADEFQATNILMPFDKADFIVDRMKKEHYIIKYINITVLKNGRYLNILWEKNVDNTEWKYVTSRGMEFATHSENEWYVSIMDTCYFENQYFCIKILHKQVDSNQILVMNKPAEEFLKTIEKMDEFFIRIQTVAVTDGNELFVSAIFDKNVSNIKSVSFVQMSVENFIYVLGQQSHKGLGLCYCKFYTVDKEAFVSAVWSNSHNPLCFHRCDVSRFGFLYEMNHSCQSNTRLQQLCSYQNDDVLNFTAIWDGVS